MLDIFDDRYRIHDEIGKFLIGEIRTDKDTRVYIFSLNASTNYYSKNGWWNTFSYTKDEALKKGYYLFPIREFRWDKNNHLNIVLASPKYSFGESKSAFYKHPDVFRFLGMSGLLSSRYTDFSTCREYDTEREYTLRKFPEHERGVEPKKIAWIYLEKLIDGDVTVESLDEMLHVESVILDWFNSEWQARWEYILHHYRSSERYQLAYKKIARYIDREGAFGFDQYLTDMYFAYQDLLHAKKVPEVKGKFFDPATGKMDIMQMLEFVAEYYHEEQERKKLEKKMKRKEGKRAPEESVRPLRGVAV